MAAFTDRDRREFVRNGFLVRDDLLGDDLIDPAYDAVVDAIDADPDDPDDVVGSGYRANTDGVDQGPFGDIVDALYHAVEELVGEGVLAPPDDGMQIALNFPGEDARAAIPRPERLGGHLDGYADFEENPEVSTFTVGAAVYVDDVSPRGGGFTVWPGSHRVAGAYFEDHALETAGGAPHNSQLPAVRDASGESRTAGEHADAGEAGQSVEWDYDARLWEQYDPYEIAGDAGTVVLWHSLLTHTAGTNTGEDVRMSAISRFAHGNDDEIRRDAAVDPFGYWPAMAGVPLVEGGEPVAPARSDR